MFGRITAIAGLAALIGGCGGDGSSFLAFEGRWIGNQAFFNLVGTRQDEGSLFLEIDRFGVVNGDIVRLNPSENVPVVGVVTAGGRMSFSWTFSGERTRTANGDVTVSGGRLRPAREDRRLDVSNDRGPVGEIEFELSRTN